jgi:hypothetical protein
VPRGQLPNHEQPAQEIQVAPYRGLADAQRPGELRRIPHPAVVVGEHAPETEQRGRRDRHPERGQVSLEEGPHQVPSPRDAVFSGPGEIGRREAAAEPEPVERPGPDLAEREARQLDHLQPAGERLRGLTQQVRRRAAEDQEARGQRPPVHEHPQHGEEIGAPLHLVDHHRPLEAGEGRHRLIEASQAGRVLEVEVVGRARGHELAGKGRLPALARADESHDPAPT